VLTADTDARLLGDRYDMSMEARVYSDYTFWWPQGPVPLNTVSAVRI